MFVLIHLYLSFFPGLLQHLPEKAPTFKVHSFPLPGMGSRYYPDMQSRVFRWSSRYKNLPRPNRSPALPFDLLHHRNVVPKKHNLLPLRSLLLLC